METIKNYIIIGLTIALGIMIYINTRPEPIPDDVTITIPGSSGSSGDVIVDNDNDSIPDPEVIEVPVYIKGDTEIVVDQEYKDKYEKAIKEKDSIEARNLYLESIQIKEYNEIAIDNDTIKVDLYAKTRGQLLAYRVNYDIKEKKFTYTPEVMHVRPKMTVLTGLELILPPTGTSQPDVKFDIYFQTQNGNAWGGGIDTQGNKYIGFKKSWTLLK
jgi:hypothetical protein